MARTYQLCGFQIVCLFVLLALVVSHWFLDLIVHRPDLPLAPEMATKVGLGLWYSWSGTLIIESIIFIAGAYIYLKKTNAKNGAERWGFWSLIALLALIHVGNFKGPVPTQVSDITGGAQMQWLLVIMAFWVDKNRLAADAGKGSKIVTSPSF